MSAMESGPADLAAKAEMPESDPAGQCSRKGGHFDSSKRFHEALRVWCRMTGGWDKVDKAIRDKYPPGFSEIVDMMKQGFPTIFQFCKDSAVPKPSVPSSSKPAAPKPSTKRRARHFDVAGATRAFYEVVTEARCPSTTQPKVIEKVFDGPVKIWWEGTGSYVIESVLAPYPRWFLDKLAMSKRHPVSGGNSMPGSTSKKRRVSASKWPKPPA